MSTQLNTNWAQLKKLHPVVLLAFMAILLIAASLRFPDLSSASLSQDESTMLQFTRGLLEKGYPHIERGGSEVQMATYELIPYFIAPFVKIFGWTEFAVRLPAALFGMATLVLLFIVAKRWFDYRVALFAGLMYALSPWAIYWSTNCFYPSQFQFFSLLSVMMVHRLFQSSELRNRDYYITATILFASYLSWEGGGLLFLVYGVLGLLVFWRRWPFLLRYHAWLAFGLLVTGVVFQLVRRGLLQSPYLVTGVSRSSISGPQFAMNQPTFDPYYYIDNIFASEQLILLTLLFVFGIVFIRQQKELQFVYGYVLFSLLVYTVLLAVYAVRYMYFVLPLFLIAASAAGFKLFDWVGQTNIHATAKSVRMVAIAVAFTFISLQALVISNHGISLTGLRKDYSRSGAWELRPEMASVDYRYVMLELARLYRQGDIIITRSPFLLEAYTKLKGDYMVQNITIGVVHYNPETNSPYYRDKFVGNPVLRNKQELDDVLHRHSRVWFLATPLLPTKDVLGNELFDFIRESMTLVAEGSGVQLYLWEN